MTTQTPPIDEHLAARRPPILRALIWLVERTRITPNALTIAGTLGVGLAAVLLAAEQFWAAGFVYVAATLSDSLDGTLARYQGTSTRFGAFLDSTLDRVAEGFMLAGFAVLFARQGEEWMSGVAVLALTASFAISYARARAESLGVVSGSGGLMGRTERLVLMGPAIFMGGLTGIPELVIGALAVLSTVTVIERLMLVHRELNLTASE